MINLLISKTGNGGNDEGNTTAAQGQERFLKRGKKILGFYIILLLKALCFHSRAGLQTLRNTTYTLETNMLCTNFSSILKKKKYCLLFKVLSQIWLMY